MGTRALDRIFSPKSLALVGASPRPGSSGRALFDNIVGAGCKGEMDIMGNLYKNPDKPLTPDAFRVTRLAMVGGYALQPLWADGHGTGLFAFDYLRQVADGE